MNTRSSNRREFLKGSAAAGAALSALSVIDVAHAALSDDQIKVGVVGCGGRGTQAAENVLSAAEGVKVVALGDAFKEKAEGVAKHLTEFVKKGKAKEFGNTADVPADQCFGGLDAYEKVIASGANYVILATPPGFRPLHIAAVIAAGKNLFTEKPVGVDGPGIRKVLAAYDEAMKKGLYVVAGTQRRHQPGYLETIKQIHDGVVGDVAALRVYWNGHGIWFRPRKPDMSDVAYQLNNWYHFMWLCGDHICEQHIHNLDVANWVMKGHPEKADGAGGRTPGNPSRPSGPPEEVGNIYDNFSIDYEYPGGVHSYSSCRHLPECTSNVSEAVVGTKGVVDLSDGSWKINGKTSFSRQRNQAAISPYVQEHTDLIAHIRGSKPINELKTVAESTLTAVMGRMAAYTGKTVKWEEALNSTVSSFPEHLTWDMSLPVSPVPLPLKQRRA